MKCFLVLVVGILIIGGTMLAGCNQAGSGTPAKHGLLVSAGFANASDVSFIVIQSGDIFRVGDAATIDQLYNAVNQPDRNFVTKMVRNRLLTFVGSDGRTAYVVFGDGGDLTSHQGSSKLMRLVRSVYRTPSYKDKTHISVGSLSEVRVIASGKTTVASPKSTKQWKTAQNSTVDLLQMWNPDDLRGCIRTTKSEVDGLSSRYIEARTAQPVTFKALIVPKNFEWWPPPDTIETRPKFEDYRSSTVRVVSIQADQMRFAFEVNGGKDWILSPPLATKKFLGYNSQGQTQYGVDQFEGVVSAVTKP